MTLSIWDQFLEIPENILHPKKIYVKLPSTCFEKFVFQQVFKETISKMIVKFNGLTAPVSSFSDTEEKVRFRDFRQQTPDTGYYGLR